jgi:hypothetical protein
LFKKTFSQNYGNGKKPEHFQKPDPKSINFPGNEENSCHAGLQRIFRYSSSKSGKSDHLLVNYSNMAF